MTNLNSLTIYNILLLFPQRLYVEFALYCAKSCKPKDKQELKCIELVEKWLVDSESVTKSELVSAADAAYSANSVAYATDSAAHAAHSAYSARAAYSAAHAAHSAHSAYSARAAYSTASARAAAYSAYSARAAAYSAAEKELKLYLINMIEERYTELELTLMEVIAT